MPSILFVEDDDVIRENYTTLLEGAGFETTAFGDSASALNYYDKSPADLALLDIVLNDDADAGFKLCSQLRQRSPTLPIIFLTSLSSDIDKISGMRLGADDYITKDISVEYLVVRLKALLNRINAQREPQEPVNVLARGNLHINLDTMRATWKNQKLDLNLTQVWMIHALAKNQSHAQSPQQLMTAANIEIQPNTIVVHIRNIRNIFKQVDPDFDGIKTERSIGYRWVAED